MEPIGTIKPTVFISLLPMRSVGMEGAVGSSALFEIAFISGIGYLMYRYIRNKGWRVAQLHATGVGIFPGVGWKTKGVRYA